MRRIPAVASAGLLAVTSAGLIGLLSTAAGASSSDVVCTGTMAAPSIGKMLVPHDLIIPPGGSCAPTQGSRIGHDVIVGKGGAFFPGGTKIGHDVRANGAALVELGDANNGTTPMTVGNDVIIKNTTGPIPAGNYICDTVIHRDLVISGSSAKASGWIVSDGCIQGIDRVGRNATFTSNHNSVDVASLRVGRNLRFTHNNGKPNILVGNVALHSCVQSHNRALTAHDNRGPHNHCNLTHAAGGGGGR